MDTQIQLANYQKEFIHFLVESEVLTFGDFVTKSGRKTPYFVNTGKFFNGSRISRLGAFYAAHITKIGLDTVSTVFGPAYKGIPLCVATSYSLYQNHDMNIGYTFNRKESKTHGDGGMLVGKKLQDGDSLLIVEDVITAGTTLREIVPYIRAVADVDIRGVIISVDRCEKGTGEITAAQQAQQDLHIEIYPLITIHEIIEYLSTPNVSGFTLSEELIDRLGAYLDTYGA